MDYLKTLPKDIALKVLEDKYSLAKEIWEETYTNYVRFEYTTHYKEYKRLKEEIESS